MDLHEKILNAHNICTESLKKATVSIAQLFHLNFLFQKCIFIYYFLFVYSNLIGVSEETLKMHFKEKHKTNAIKSFMLKRTCRICNYDKAPSDVELTKHFENVHPKSDYW